jgi:hypothetical protein
MNVLAEIEIHEGNRDAAVAAGPLSVRCRMYGLDGASTWTVDGQPIEVGPGQALCIPRGAVHRFDNLGRPARRCAWSQRPRSAHSIFREMLEVMKAAAGGPPDRARIVEVMRRHGVTPAPPSVLAS